MINFFRKIRRKFADNNQFLKYSRYAVGEIVLVVIGILIALQINNWNEEKKNDLIKEVYIQRLNNDLVKDTIFLHNYIYECENDIRRLKNIKIQIEEPNATLDSIINIFTNSNLGYMPFLSEQTDATFKSLLSTGDIELFREDYMEMMMNFYNSTEYRYSIIKTWQDINLSNFEELFSEFGFLNKIKKNNLIYKELRVGLDEYKFLRMFDVVVGRRLFLWDINKNYAEEILNETKSMLEKLNQPPK